MPYSQSKSTYPVVTFVILALTSIAIVSKSLKAIEPLPVPNELVTEPDAFIKRGATQDIKWRRWGKAVMDEAKRLDKPILLVLGTAANQDARMFDDYTLSMQETSDTLGDRFVFAREDIFTNPCLATILRPLYQAKNNFNPSFQIWYLDSEGRPFYLQVPKTSNQTIDLPQLEASSESAERQLESYQNQPDLFSPPSAEQTNERNLLLKPSEIKSCSTFEHIKWLESNLDLDTGSWLSSTYYSIYPQAWQFLLQQGETELLAKSANKILSSGLVDLVEGGVFISASRSKPHKKQYDKYAMLNVDFASVMAKLYCTSDRIYYRRLAENAFDYVTRVLVKNGQFRPYEAIVPSMQNRNPRTSTSVKEFYRRYNPEEQSVLYNFLNLNVQSNPEMIPAIQNLNDFENEQEQIEKVLAKMRKYSIITARDIGEVAYCENSAYCIARLFECARILNDPVRISKIDELFIGLNAFMRPDGSLVRSSESLSNVPAYLGDYLAMSDAHWERFLVYGLDNDAVLAANWLDQAMERFKTSNRGVLRQTPINYDSQFPPDTDLPQIADSFKESTSASAIRLAWNISNYYLVKAADCSDANPNKSIYQERSRRYKSFAESGILQFGSLANEIHSNMSALFSVSETVNKDIFVVITGPNAAELARKLVHETPTANVFHIQSDANNMSNQQNLVRTYRGEKLVDDLKAIPTKSIQ